MAQASPRDQATADSFEPVSWADGLLTVRTAPGAGSSGSAIADMLASLATRAAGRLVRVQVEVQAPPRRVEGATRPLTDVAAVPGRAPSLRDDPATRHPLVLEVSALFDATIVRVEAAGTLPAPAVVEAIEPDDHREDADAMDHITHGEFDV